MAYKSLKVVITAENEKFNNGEVTTDEYASWKEATVRKMDLFLTCDRINDAQYSELTELFVA